MSVATSDMDGIRKGQEGRKNAILIAGPTASGKTALAIDLARRHDAVIVNADSMQVYGVLDKLTARPQAEELAAAPHFLFGHADPTAAYSTGKWLSDVAGVLESTDPQRLVIFVGGTGLYFRALGGGLSDMPPVPAPIREGWRQRLAAEGAEALHRELAAGDPDAAARIGRTDGQRIIRALEVLDATGRPLSEWQGRRGARLIDVEAARKLVLTPDRDWLRERIALRFDRMIAEGAVDEVRALLALEPDPALPAMKAIGVGEISCWLNGEISLTEACEKSVTKSRQYAKRQITWFRNQLGDGWEVIRKP